MKKFCLLVFLMNFSLFAQTIPPEWSKGIVWYQIFPERFSNGDSLNDPDADKVFINENYKPFNWNVTPWTSNWFYASDWEIDLGGNVRDHMYERRYGGDIQGIIDHLDYLKDLGVGAIYLNPVFEAVSLHKYDASSYHHIDFNFGPNPLEDKNLIKDEIPDDPDTWVWTSADKLFLKLIDEVHKRNMKIIIDGVFNHTGIQFWAFQDIVKKQSSSKYKDWYKINSFDDSTTAENEFKYKGWWNVPTLPEFNRTEDDLNPGPKQYIFYATKRWMDPNGDGNTEDGIDGWRLDVAREVPLGFWRSWSSLVKSINPNAFLVGELWEISPDFIGQNGVFDALMNYNFSFAINDFFVALENKIPVTEFISRLKKIDESYPELNLYSLQNLLDSHDTERILSIIKNPDRPYDRLGNEGNSNYDPSKPDSSDIEMLKLILSFQLTWRGAAMIYYGDEVGMWGADDPHDRKPMLWSNLNYDDEIISSGSGFKKGFGKYKVSPNLQLLNFYKKMIRIRNQSEALKLGDVQFLYANNEKISFAFERTYKKEKIIVAFNLGNETNNFDLVINGNKIFYDELITQESGSAAGSESDATKLNILLPAKSVKIFKIFNLKQ